MTERLAPWAALLLVATLVGIVARRLNVPYSVGLVVAGIGLAFLPWHPAIALSHDLVYTAILPPLIFEAAFELRWESLRRNLAVVMALATAGVVLSAVTTGAIMWGVMHWPPPAAALFGILIAATDPVSVLATLKEIGAHGRLALLIEAESLLNDATAAVLFTVALGVVTGGPLTYQSVVSAMGTTIIVGALVGTLVGGGVLAIIGRTDDHLIEITLTAIAAYGSFLLAEHFGGSGILATLSAGMIIGNLAPRWRLLSDAAQRVVRSTWEFITFVANSLIFLLIGLAAGQANPSGLWWASSVAILAVLIGRCAAVYPLCALFRSGADEVSTFQQHALVWGGLRGALALALVLSIPDTLPWTHQIVTVTFSVVAFSVVVQGLTCRPLFRRACSASSTVTAR